MAGWLVAFSGSGSVSPSRSSSLSLCLSPSLSLCPRLALGPHSLPLLFPRARGSRGGGRRNRGRGRQTDRQTNRPRNQIERERERDGWPVGWPAGWLACWLAGAGWLAAPGRRRGRRAALCGVGAPLSGVLRQGDKFRRGPPPSSLESQGIPVMGGGNRKRPSDPDPHPQFLSKLQKFRPFFRMPRARCENKPPY